MQAYQNHKLTKASNIINCSRINLANHAYDKETNHITHHATVPLQSGSERFGLLNVASLTKNIIVKRLRTIRICSISNWFSYKENSAN